MDRLLERQATPLDRNLARELSLSSENDGMLLGKLLLKNDEHRKLYRNLIGIK